MCIPTHGRSKYTSLWERLLANTEENKTEVGWADCWNWVGKTKCKYQYGRFNFYVPGLGRNKTLSAHLASWILTEVVPENSNEFYLFYLELLTNPCELDHKCNNESCINPDHLQLLTVKENNARRQYS